MALNAGALDKRIIIEQVTESRSASGDVVQSWSMFATVWAQAMWKGGSEFRSVAQMRSDVDVIWRMRSGHAVTNRMRVKYGTRLFDILAIDDLDPAFGVRLLCKEGQRRGS